MKKTGLNQIILLPIIICSMIVINIAPFIHIDFPKKSNEVIRIEQKISDFKSQSNLDLEKIRKQYDIKNITAEKYIEQLDSLTEIHSSTLLSLKSELKTTIDTNRVFGFRSIRTFLIGFGIRLPYLFFSFSILSLFLYSRNKLSQNKNLFIAVKILYNSSFLISFYLLAWFIIPRQDYSPKAYYLMIGLISITSSFISIYLTKHYLDFINRLKRKIQTLISFIKNNRNKYLELAVEATIADPNNKDKIKRDLQKYDDELFNTLKEINK